jgi:hypothetical protein
VCGGDRCLERVCACRQRLGVRQRVARDQRQVNLRGLRRRSWSFSSRASVSKSSTSRRMLVVWLAISCR